MVLHYLNRNLEVRSLLGGLKRVKGSHSGENIAVAVIPIIIVLGIKDQLGFFIGDNARPNDTTVRAILTKLRPNIEDPDSRRVRYLGHIINLAAKALLFGKDTDAFEEESQTKKQLTKLEAARELWSKKGPLRKFHNTISFTRKTPQRREAFLSICEDGITSGIEGVMSPRISAAVLAFYLTFYRSNGHRRQRDSIEFNLPLHSTWSTTGCKDSVFFPESSG
jgi:hypothetical protein